MRDAINKNYNRYLMKEAAELRTAQVREVVEEHFRTTAGILEEMAGEFSLYEHFDEEAAQRVEDILRDNGVTPLEVCCRIDKFDRMTIEAEVGRTDKNGSIAPPSPGRSPRLRTQFFSALRECCRR